MIVRVVDRNLFWLLNPWIDFQGTLYLEFEIKLSYKNDYHDQIWSDSSDAILMTLTI